MALYEAIFIARQDLTESQVEQLRDTYINVIKENGGQVANTEYWGLRKLAYPIKKNSRGHYVFMNIDASGAAVHEMERQMGINEDLMRSFVVRVDKFEEGPTAVLRKVREYDEPRETSNEPFADAV